MDPHRNRSDHFHTAAHAMPSGWRKSELRDLTEATRTVGDWIKTIIFGSISRRGLDQGLLHHGIILDFIGPPLSLRPTPPKYGPENDKKYKRKNGFEIAKAGNMVV